MKAQKWIVILLSLPLILAGCSNKPAGPELTEPEKIEILKDTANKSELIIDGIIMTQSSCQSVPPGMRLTYGNGMTPAQMQKKYHDIMVENLSGLETNLMKYLMLANKKTTMAEDMDQILTIFIPVFKNALTSYSGNDNTLSQGNYCEVMANSRASINGLLTDINISLQAEGGGYTPETPEKKQERLNNEYLKGMKLEVIK